MVNNKYKKIIQELKTSFDAETLYGDRSHTAEYERKLVELMIFHSCTFREALALDFDKSNVDISSVLDIVDYLEHNLSDFGKIEYFMRIYTEQAPDLVLEKITKKNK